MIDELNVSELKSQVLIKYEYQEGKRTIGCLHNDLNKDGDPEGDHWFYTCCEYCPEYCEKKREEFSEDIKVY